MVYGKSRVGSRWLGYQLRRVKRIKTWQLLVVIVVVAFLAATFLRYNNLGMVERREAVMVADESADKQAITKALVDLQRYVSAHMNTGLGGGVYLEKSYARDRAAALNQAANATNPNSAAYNQAALDCRSRFQGGANSFRSDYVQCVVERVAALGEGTDAVSSLLLPRADSYKYNFSSPLLSFDLAGLFVALSLLLTGITVLRLVAIITLHQLLKRRRPAM